MKYKKYLNPHAYSDFDTVAICSLCGHRGAYRLSDSMYCDGCISSEKAAIDLRDKDDFPNDWDITNLPPIRKWQEWPWPVCCSEIMVYVCELSKETIRSYSGNLEPEEFIKENMPECEDGMDYFHSLRNVDNASEKGNYDLMLHYFVCDKCGKKFIQFDAS
jgi:hypothetical protein